MNHTGNQETLRNRFTDKLSYFLRYYEASRLSCGMIFARCEKNNDPEWTRLQDRLQESDPDRAAQFFYDDSAKLLVVLLDDTNLSDTHYFALPIKALLQTHHQLKGNVCIASFPESGETMDDILQELKDRLETPAHQPDLIQIVVRPDSDFERKPCLLLIENDPIVRRMLKIRFERYGFDVHLAQDGQEGMDQYIRQQPDVVITELNLPIVDGYQLIDWLQKHQGAQSSCKIVVLTDKRLEEDMAKCFQRGVADYITKPFSPVELELRIRRLLVS
jgi:two-component system OmpR family response regulator